MRIADVAQQSQTTPSTLRYYEKIGLLPLTARRNGQRMYEPSVLKRLAFIRAAKATGFSLDEIKGYLNARDKTNWRPLVEKKLRELDAAIYQYRVMQDCLLDVLRRGQLENEFAPLDNQL